MRKPRVTVADLDNLPRNVKLVCRIHPEDHQYSATPGDYFMAPHDHVFKCCRAFCVLATRTVEWTEYKR